MNKKPCFVCGKALGKTPALVRCEDEQTVYVGRECFKRIKAAGNAGWLPEPDKHGLTGPRLYLLDTPGLPMYPLIVEALSVARR